ncbi:MAG TPA: LPS-assembly protein LptD [Rhodocyclaceae bacterium]|nr:LPS-assembly protein LptD [Rhodocyclaceae bacterium]
MRATRLTTPVKLAALLLFALPGAVPAAGLPPLLVAPELIGEQGRAAAPDAGATAPESRAERPAASDGPGGRTPPDAAGRAVPGGRTTPAASAGPRARQPAPGETEVRALRILGVRAVELVAEGEAELQRDDIILSADRLVYNELTDEARAEGNVRLLWGDDRMTGQWARLIVHEWVGEFDAPSYFITRPSRSRPADADAGVSGSGRADKLFFEGENQYRLLNATWSTCRPESPDWYIRADELELDYDREVGVARGSSLVFKDVPILWWPWMEFPLAEQRQSGFLVPTVGVSNRTGLDVSLPYYWNIAPNYDATIAPRLMGRRGLQLAGEFRYLTPDYHGETRAEWLPQDRATGETRALGSIQHQHRITPRLFGSVDLNAVSDDEYFEDLSSRLAVASRVNLLREARLFYAGGSWWSASALAQSYQTLSGEDPYRRLPQLALDARRDDLAGGAVFAFKGEYVDFRHPDGERAEGRRLTIYPQLSLPFERPAFFVTPKIGFHHTRYDLTRPLPGGPGAISRSLPVLSIDSGLHFERDARLFGQSYLQTLEPRLFYVRIPFRDQRDIPVFDSARYDFGFAQIFSENRYAGGDRIADANQVTAAVTTRLLDPESGAERGRATVGQRYYFSNQKVTLNELGKAPVESLRTSRRTDILAALSGRLTRSTLLESAWQYNPFDSTTERLNIGFRYQPEFAKVFNISYRFARDLLDGRDGLEDVDLSAQWPLGGRWYGVGRITRSIRDGRLTEAIAGFEYASECGCWVLRTAAHRFATNPDRVTNALFVQLELNGLGSIGPSPVNLLERSVPGYGKINEPITDPIFSAD